MNLLVIHNDLFRQVQAIKPLDSNENERRQMKYSCLDLIKSKVKRRWDRAVKLTRVIDEIIFKATDRGYSFNGRETLAKLCNCGLSTVDEALRVLRESGEVVIGYRENPNSNGYKTPVVFLKNHPHFKYWNNILGLEKYVNQELDQEVKNAEKPCHNKEEGAKKIPTYSLPSFSKNNHLNTSRKPYIKFVPKSLQHYQTYFGKQIKDLYSRVWLAAKRLNIHSDNYETMQQIGHIAFNWLKLQRKSGNQLTEEQMCKAVYKIALKQLQDRLEEGELYDPSDWFTMPETAPKPVYEPSERVSIEELDELGVY